MLTSAGIMLIGWFNLANNKGIPMAISTQNEMSCLRSTLNRSMKFDLDQISQLLGNEEVFVLRGKHHITAILFIAILPKLKRMPLVRLLKTRKSARDTQLFTDKEPLECLGETICKTLNGSSRDILSTTLKSLLQFILIRKCSILLILVFNHLKHLIIDLARLNQALHQQGTLFFVRVNSILIRLHALYSTTIIRSCPVAIHPTPEGSGHSCHVSVELHSSNFCMGLLHGQGTGF